mgnify:CR=1 FL=1
MEWLFLSLGVCVLQMFFIHHLKKKEIMNFFFIFWFSPTYKKPMCPMFFRPWHMSWKDFHHSSSLFLFYDNFFFALVEFCSIHLLGKKWVFNKAKQKSITNLPLNIYMACHDHHHHYSHSYHVIITDFCCCCWNKFNSIDADLNTEQQAIQANNKPPSSPHHPLLLLQSSPKFFFW